MSEVDRGDVAAILFWVWFMTFILGMYLTHRLNVAERKIDRVLRQVEPPDETEEDPQSEKEPGQ